MALRLLEKNDGTLLEVHASGRLTHQDYQRFMPQFEHLVERHGKISILFILEDFRGWKAAALWDDIKLDWKHFNSIQRLAIVGSRRWQKWMSEFCKPFTTADIRYFDRISANKARIWIEGKAESIGTDKAPILRVFQSRAQTKAYYNKISRFYDLLSDRSESPMRKTGLELLKVRAGEHILEIGFGTGHTLSALAKAVGSRGKVFGIDLSDRMVKLAKENLTKAGLMDRVRLRCGDATQLPYPADSIDAIFMSFALELFDTPEIPRVLSECQRVLRPKGRMVVVGMSKDSNREPLVGVFEWTHKHFPNFLDCRPIYVSESLKAAGFKIQKVLKKHMWVPVEIALAVK